MRTVKHILKLTIFVYLANQVQSIGDSIEEDTSRRSIIQHKPFKQNKNRRRDSIQLDPKDPDSRIVVPVTQKKLNKLLMFYYIKRRYPKLVDHIVDTETGGLKTNIQGSNASLTVNLNKSISALEELSENPETKNFSYVHPETREGPQNIEDAKSQSVVTGEQLEAMKAITTTGNLKDKTIDSIMSNLVDHEVGETKNAQSQFESMNIDLDDGDSTAGNRNEMDDSPQRKHATHVQYEDSKKVSLDQDKTDSKPFSEDYNNSENVTASHNEKVSNADLSGVIDRQSLVKKDSKDFEEPPDDPSNSLIAAKSLLKDVEDLQQSISKGQSESSNNFIKPINNVANDCGQVSCIAKELVNLFDQTYVEKNQERSNENANKFIKTNLRETESFVNTRDSNEPGLQSEVRPHVEGNTDTNLIKEFSKSGTENQDEIASSNSVKDNKLDLQSEVTSTDSKDSHHEAGGDAIVSPQSKTMKDDNSHANANSHQYHKQKSSVNLIENHSPSQPNEGNVEVFPGFFRHKYPQEETGQTRKGGDPYSTIGHNSLRHEHDESSVVANKYYDKSIGKFFF